MLQSRRNVHYTTTCRTGMGRGHGRDAGGIWAVGARSGSRPSSVAAGGRSRVMIAAPLSGTVRISVNVSVENLAGL